MKGIERRRNCWTIITRRDIDDSCNLFSPKLTREVAGWTDENNRIIWTLLWKMTKNQLYLTPN